MQASDKFYYAITENFVAFWRRNYLIILVPFALGLFVHSFDIFNHFFGVDELYFYQLKEKITTDLHVQRWFLVSENILLGLINPPIAQILALFLMSVSASIFAEVIFKKFQHKILFSILFMIFPVFGSTMMSSFIVANLAFAVFLSAMCFKYFDIAVRLKYPLVIIGIVLACVLGTYQSLLSVFPTALVLRQVVLYYEKEATLKNIFKNLLFGALCCLIAVALHYLVTVIFNMPLSDYGRGFTGTGNSLMDVLSSYCTNTYRMLIGIRVWPAEMRFASFAFLAFLTHWAFKRKDFGIIFMLMLGFLVASILHNLIARGFSPVRSQLALHIFFAGCITLYFMIASKMEKLFIYLSTAVLILLSANYMSKLYMADFYERRHENMVATRVVENIFKVSPETYYQKTKTLFVGRVKSENQTQLFKKYDMFGHAHVDFTLMWYLNTMGFPANFDLVGADSVPKEVIDKMPLFPTDGFVQKYNDILVIKLGDN